MEDCTSCHKKDWWYILLCQLSKHNPIPPIPGYHLSFDRRTAVAAYQKLIDYIRILREDKGMSLTAIADRFNEEGQRTRTGKKFYPMTVKRVLDRVEPQNQ
jgi:hypothetical protein